MVNHTPKLTRAESARINGAKSRGPKTAEGLFRARTAGLKHGLYATNNYLLPGESVPEFQDLQAQLRADFQPAGFYANLLVNQLAGNLWETIRTQAAKSDYIHDCLAAVSLANPHLRDSAKRNLLAQSRAMADNGTYDRADTVLARLSREREKIERSLLRLEKRHTASSGPSQKLLEINTKCHPDLPETQDPQTVPGTLAEAPYITTTTQLELVPPPEPAEPTQEATPEPGTPESGIPETSIRAWAETALDFHPDAFQQRILEETNSRILVLGPRQTGKSTAAAVRVLHEAMSHDDAVILLASASGRQSGQIMDKARKMAKSIEVELFPPPPKCDGFSLANGAQVIALPDSEETIRGFSAPRLIVVDEAAFASEEVFKALEPMLTVSAGTILLLSTPNGQTGYFYEQWHNDQGPWTKLQGKLEDCPRVNLQAIENMRQTMSKDDFAQEFECKFVAAGGQFISREVLEACLRDDFELFCTEFDKEEI